VNKWIASVFPAACCGEASIYKKEKRRHESAKIHHRGHRERNFRFLKSSLRAPTVGCELSGCFFSKRISLDKSMRAQRGKGSDFIVFKSFLSVLCG
jgi:thermostable 8-oxoguanine DNA glycosylase